MPAAETITPGWLTRKGAKAYCGLSIPTIDRAIRAGAFEIRRVGRTPLINRESLDAWIRGKAAQPPSPA
jgi:excisionase family DNA binding protein